jgi:hypothetical protein
MVRPFNSGRSDVRGHTGCILLGVAASSYSIYVNVAHFKISTCHGNRYIENIKLYQQSNVTPIYQTNYEGILMSHSGKYGTLIIA